MKFWPSETYVLHTKRSKEHILKTLSVYTIPGEPVLKIGIKTKNKKFIGHINDSGFEITPIPEYNSRGLMPSFKGTIVESDGQSEILIRTGFSQASIVTLGVMVSFLIIIWAFLLSAQTSFSFGCLVPGLMLIWLYVIMLIGFHLGLKAFKKRFKEVFFDLF